MTYGFGQHNIWRAVGVSNNSSGGSDFSVVRSGEKICEVSLPLSGHHNVLNALAAFVAALALGMAHDSSWVTSAAPKSKNESSSTDPSAAIMISNVVVALGSYQGIARRMQHIGTVGKCAVYDDYAHHPTAIHAVVKATRERFPGYRLVIVFQPHTYSRTTALLHEFAAALSLADRVIVTAIYDARAEANFSSCQVSGQDLARLIKGKSLYLESLQDTARQLVIDACSDQASSRESCGVDTLHLPAPRTHTHEDNDIVILCLGAGSSNELSATLFGHLLAKKRRSSSLRYDNGL